ncbi:unnamed protein product [Rotaria sp. Silwood1]|nr:unnamed protein product [Rotaria sp. Silwood1]CAF1369930.1 unnamed protein product [Rotaria sp. Silwood1]
MITTLETIPNEILLMIFSHLSWFELLMSLSSLNKRFDRLICSILSKIDNKSNNGLVIINPGLSYNKYNSILLPLISNPLLPFASCIQRLHFDGTICNDSDLSYKWLFDNDKKILHFPNLKSLILTRCLLVEPLIKSLPIFIKYQLDELRLTFDRDIITLLRYPNGLSAMDLRTGQYITTDNLQLIVSEMPFENEKCKLTDIQLRNVTRLDFNLYFDRTSGNYDESIDRIKARAKVLAHLISIPVQLKDLRAFDELRKNALNTVQYAEFRIPSCHRGSNESIRIGQNLVPFLSTYMSNLQTLRLWRLDDFPWTSIRPDYNKHIYSYSRLVNQWYKSL